MKLHSLPFIFLFTVSSCLQTDSAQKLLNKTSGPEKIVFRSSDGGETWQDISQNLPPTFQADSIRSNNFFANEKGLYLRINNEIYHNNSKSSLPVWTKENFPESESRIVSSQPRSSYWGINLKTTNGKSVWSPMFENYQEPKIRSIFETAGGSIFIGIDRGIFRSTDYGATWKQVFAGGLVGHLAEAKGVLLSISMRTIIRSTDNGETWFPVTSEDSTTWDVKPINGGFVAITADSESGARRLSTSYDAGKTWQSIHSPLQAKDVIESIWRTWNNRPVWQASMSSITPSGDYLYCTHTEGIFRSSDRGKNWKLSLPSQNKLGFNLFFSGSVIYAIRSKGGC